MKPGSIELTTECRRVSAILSRVGDKWTVLVVRQLGPGARRFSEIRRALGSISQKMLTTTLRGLERDGFVTRVAGAVGVREHPVGSDRPGDVDSGPLVAGVSLSVSTVTVAAARAHGDLTLATDLVRQAEVAGIPIDVAGERRYALGVLPVGDAFLAWARSVPIAPVEPAPADAATAPRPLWWVWLAPWLLALGVVLAVGGRSVPGPSSGPDVAGPRRPCLRRDRGGRRRS